MNSEETNDYENNALAQCPECVSGLMHLRYLTYFTWLNDELITVPNFPAWVCDLCGRREYDSRAITWLNALLSPETRGKRRRKRRFSKDHERRHPNKPVYPE